MALPPVSKRCLGAQAASGYVSCDATAGTFWLSPEQAAVLADENSPVLMTGGFYSLTAIFADEPKLTEAFKTGKSLGWGDRCNCLFCGVERFFRPGYKGHLVSEWLPALDGVVAKLERGAKAADVGCGRGNSGSITFGAVLTFTAGFHGIATGLAAIAVVVAWGAIVLRRGAPVTRSELAMTIGATAILVAALSWSHIEHWILG